MTPPTPYYRDDAVTIYHGDCREIVPMLGRFDLLLTDPPYDEKTHSGARYGFRETSSKIPFAPLQDIAGLVPVLLGASNGWVICFCALEMFGDYKAASGSSWVRAGFWRRPNGVPQFTGDRPGQPGEGIAIMHSGETCKAWNGNGRHGFWEFCIEQHNRVHPTQKPMPLMQALVSDFSDYGDTILDPFAGSGTTGRAAKDLGRKCVLIEREERYCEIAARRMAQEVLPLGA